MANEDAPISPESCLLHKALILQSKGDPGMPGETSNGSKLTKYIKIMICIHLPSASMLGPIV